MPRPQLDVGTYGTIRVTGQPGRYVAFAQFRDLDGKTRQVERSGSTKARAKDRLKEAIRDRARLGGGINGDTRIAEIAPEWLSMIDAAVEAGERSPSTAEQYRRQLKAVVLPGVGELRVREATVPVLDAFVDTVRSRRGPSVAKLARSVLSGVLGVAVRHGAIRSNPVRDVSRIPTGRRKASRSLTPAECRAWLAQLDADEAAREKDLPDLCRFMLGTGVRIGEALAVDWADVDLVGATVTVEHTLIRLTRIGLVRKSTKSEAGERVLRLPRFLVVMLRERNLVGRIDGPVFPDSLGGWRDPSNTSRNLREARGSEGFAWVTSHVFRKTCATILDTAGQTPRAVADQLGHAQVSMTQNYYFGRRIVNPAAAAALDAWHEENENHG
jgi:integrase